MTLAFCSWVFSFKGACNNILYDGYQFDMNSDFSIIHAGGHAASM
jgi:hypothetical protein